MCNERLRYSFPFPFLLCFSLSICLLDQSLLRVSSTFLLLFPSLFLTLSSGCCCSSRCWFLDFSLLLFSLLLFLLLLLLLLRCFLTLEAPKSSQNIGIYVVFATLWQDKCCILPCFWTTSSKTLVFNLQCF